MSAIAKITAHYLELLLDRAGLSASIPGMHEEITVAAADDARAFVAHKSAAVGPTEIRLNPLAAAALDRELRLDEIAEELVRHLFTNGQGNQAARLELIDGDGRGVGGWGPGPVRDHVLEALRQASTSAPAELEAIQDEEAILRLALAFRALSRDIEWDERPPAYKLVWKLADYLEDPSAARDAIAAADRRNARTRRTR